MAKKKELRTLGIGNICPNCKSAQFSISVPDIRPDDWPSNILGFADCRNCNQNFLVKLSPELENAFVSLLRNSSCWMETPLLRDIFFR